MGNTQQSKAKSIKCPKCGKANKITLWGTVIADKNPKIKNKILRNELFIYRCNECGNTHMLAWPMAYIDNEKRFVVYLAPQTMALVELNLMLAQNDPHPGFKVRITENLEDFIDKVRYLDMGLDDRVIELMKASILMSPNVPANTNFNKSRTIILPTGEFSFAFFGNGIMTTIADVDQYNAIKEAYAYELSLPDVAPETVDLTWAFDLILSKY